MQVRNIFSNYIYLLHDGEEDIIHPPPQEKSFSEGNLIFFLGGGVINLHISRTFML